MREHPDLPNPPVAHLKGIDYAYKRHGNSVLGILVARHNTIGVAGIAPNATVRTVSVFEEGTYVMQPSAAITYAANRMAAGDVLLIEDQLGGVKPLELEPLSLTAIKTAVGNLLVVIEPAGNGGLPLDDQVTPGNQRILRRHSRSFVDSGSIIVGACKGPAPAVASGWSNFGCRVDCCASGDGVTTTDGVAPWYTHTFNGTSSASAIVAGAAAVIQGRVKALGRTPLRSRQMRWVLKTYSASIAAGQPAIGGVPDLGAVFTKKAWVICRPREPRLHLSRAALIADAPPRRTPRWRSRRQRPARLGAVGLARPESNRPPLTPSSAGTPSGSAASGPHPDPGENASTRTPQDVPGCPGWTPAQDEQEDQGDRAADGVDPRVWEISLWG